MLSRSGFLVQKVSSVTAFGSVRRAANLRWKTRVSGRSSNLSEVPTSHGTLAPWLPAEDTPTVVATAWTKTLMRSLPRNVRAFASRTVYR